MKAFDYVEPHTIDEAVGALSDGPGRARALAGGTDLLVRLKRREWEADRIVNLKRVDGLSGITLTPGHLSIGALTSVADLGSSTEVLRLHPILAQAALEMASPQVRNLATVGGNLCNASPAADLAPPLLCLGAVLRTIGPHGERLIPIESFFTGPGKTALGRAELLAEIRVPLLASRGTFLKLCPRNAMDLAIVSVACTAMNGDTRVAVGAAAPTPILVAPDPQQAAAHSSPIDDVRASAEYRREMVRVLVRRALEATA